MDSWPYRSVEIVTIEHTCIAAWKNYTFLLINNNNDNNNNNNNNDDDDDDDNDDDDDDDDNNKALFFFTQEFKLSLRSTPIQKDTN